MIDLVIRGGTVFDGTGREALRADLAIEGDRIAAIGEVPANGAPELDATDLYVAPGFIDVHSHSDYTLLVDPRARSAIHQGVTLEVVGNCGFGCFPIHDPELARKAIYGYSPDVPLDWRSAGEYFDRLQAAKPAVNVVSLVPNGQLRLSTVGLADRPAEPGEAAAMADLLRESLGEGAWGYSTGLEYAQEAAATEEEITGLCHALAPSEGLYATHTRRRDAGATDSVAEAIRAARSAGVRLQVSHLVPRNGIAESRRSMEIVEEARDLGLDVEFDMHTRLYGLTHLYAALPPWALAEEPAALRELLADPAARDRMRPHRSLLSAGNDWSRIMLLDNPFWPQYARQDVASIARDRGQDALDTVYDLLVPAAEAPHELMVIIHAYTEEEQREAFAHPLCVPGSDATTLAPDGPLGGTWFHGAYTWASWFYRFMVREEKLLTPAQAVHKLTGQPAARLGLDRRGVLQPGAFADVTVFDPARFEEKGTTFEPNQLAAGVVHVLVNGVHTLRDGEATGNAAVGFCAGEILKALVWYGERDVRYEDAPDPVPADGEVVFDVELAGICGSDLHGYRGHPGPRVPPLVLGHEVVGRVGEATYTLYPLVACGRCARCLAGEDNLCASWRLIGMHRPGVFSERLAVPTTSLVPVPPGLDPRRAVLAEPLACCVGALSHYDLEADDEVAVFGCGPIGLLSAYVAARAGAHVTVVDPVAERRENALRLGAHEGVAGGDELPPAGASLVVDAAGFEATWRAAIAAVRNGGDIVILGLGQAEAPFPMAVLVRRAIALRGQFAYTRADFDRAVAILAEGDLDLGWLSDSPLAEGAEAFANLADRPAEYAKVILSPS